jgi:hypothetical protein
MPTNMNDLIKAMPAAQRRKVEARAAEIIAEEMSMRELRKAAHKTQTSIAKSLGIGQDGVSRIESQSDMFLSTLRRYVEATGGTLRLIAEFPNRRPVLLSGIAGIDPEPPKPKRRAARA